MINEYQDPYMPDEEDMVTVGDLRPYGHEVKYKQRIGKRILKQRAKESFKAEIEADRLSVRGIQPDNRTLRQRGSPWADSIEALEIYENKMI